MSGRTREVPLLADLTYAHTLVIERMAPMNKRSMGYVDLIAKILTNSMWVVLKHIFLSLLLFLLFIKDQ